MRRGGYEEGRVPGAVFGYEHLQNYYGAWEEWGNRGDLPLATK